MSPLTKTLIGAVLLFLVVMGFVILGQSPTPRTLASLDIGVEHKGPMTLDMTVTRNDTQRMIDIGNDKTEEMQISLPEYWTRGEVRNVPLANVKAEEPSFGYIRWHLPPTASVSFRTTHPFEKLLLHNPSGILLKVRFTLVDLLKNSGEKQVYLVKEGAVSLP